MYARHHLYLRVRVCMSLPLQQPTPNESAIPCVWQELATISATTVRTLFEDRSADGLVSHAELEEYIAADLQRGAVPFETGPARNRQRAGPRNMEDEKHFTMVDTDASGGVDLAELRTYYASQGFSNEQITAFVRLLDADGDGTVSRTEWRQALSNSRKTLRERKVRSLKGLGEYEDASGEGSNNEEGTDDPALASSLQLEALTAPVKPPKATVFNDLLVERSRHLGERAQDAAYAPPKRIARTQDRAIRLHQLNSLVEHIERRCLREKWVSAYSGAPLSAEKVNLYVCRPPPPTHTYFCSAHAHLVRSPCATGTTGARM